ncbi:DNA-processing protein DprA [Aquabacterium sp. A08]|uniref:DNA-processing protein DprA n=1 Tax=Aquabacterium sp. A08 TaxID=2718532 RepID=UPI00142322B9|nr:DNA-processing protein DprA [Aquabacterium sp. A08]NIC43001.1 DNA-protecting protein DprA [Aquabacterium sp. A08]
MTDAELGAWLRLTLTPGVGNGTARKLLAAFGSPEGVFQQPPDAWSTVVGPRLATALASPPEGWRELCQRTRDWLAADGRHHLLALGDADYPADLLQTADPPLLLHLLGQRSALAHPHKLAIVGSRNPTPQGAENAARFAQTLATQGLCVVSGLALGVDGAAHQGALDGGGPTLAVVGTGLDRVYPKRHLALAHRIADQGALLSEYPLGTPPLSPNFPKRNRLIAGLSQGTLVVEAALQSGSLITAQLATEMGREVFAIPGSIHAPQSRGCHALIRQGAKLVESAQDILEDLHLAPAARAATPAAPPDSPSDPLLEALGFDPVGLDALQARTGLDTPTLQAELLGWELEGRVHRLPGGLFQRVGLG